MLCAIGSVQISTLTYDKTKQPASQGMPAVLRFLESEWNGAAIRGTSLLDDLLAWACQISEEASGRLRREVARGLERSRTNADRDRSMSLKVYIASCSLLMIPRPAKFVSLLHAAQINRLTRVLLCMFVD